MRNISKYQLATSIAILFHIVGFAGIVIFKSDVIIKTTALNMLLMVGLLFYTQEKNKGLLLFLFAVCFFVGFAVEIIGTSTGFLFGDYEYGNVLGPKINGVPLIIGVNWFIIIFCCGTAMQMLMKKIKAKLAPAEAMGSNFSRALSIIIDGATLAVLFDWLMEPVAMKLGYWQWLGNGEIPFYNYVSWLIVSIMLLFVFERLKFSKENKFAVNLLLIQTMFFLLLRTFL